MRFTTKDTEGWENEEKPSVIVKLEKELLIYHCILTLFLIGKTIQCQLKVIENENVIFSQPEV